MKTKHSLNYKIKYSKDGKKNVHLMGRYSKRDYWTIILGDIQSLRELGDLINAVRQDILEQPLWEDVQS